ncbi:hypothetical protein [Jeotgalibacillus sp. R-1-5s-1]|uniref:hypothetical protein n=1 Tax=Jeotgalibacillus sp. R-1-5s-1 TaxID=2555897 RepID=UPI00106DC06D|nr:hypothetical protein [Jeotgalibacillus sp. R-1-5s-1]TFD94429.1 hypothetical protein E2491_13415 [Jeotgalibacillus sp. R-1-5s-1]
MMTVGIVKDLYRRSIAAFFTAILMTLGLNAFSNYSYDNSTFLFFLTLTLLMVIGFPVSLLIDRIVNTHFSLSSIMRSLFLYFVAGILSGVFIIILLEAPYASLFLLITSTACSVIFYLILNVVRQLNK